jgi:hypothetical protein
MKDFTALTCPSCGGKLENAKNIDHLICEYCGTHISRPNTADNMWLCNKCHTKNLEGKKFCSKCGNQLGHECINCNYLVLIGDVFCPHCGINFAQEEARRLAQQQESERQRTKAKAEREVREIEARRKKEMEDTARVSRQQEVERIKNEQEVRSKIKQRNSKRALSFASTIFIVICAFTFYTASGKANIFSFGFSSQNATKQAVESLYSPTWKGNTVQVQVQLTSATSDNFQVKFNVTNMTQSEIFVTFLTSDILITDNLGNQYPVSDDTTLVQYTSGANRNNEYYIHLRFSGAIDPSATSLIIKMPPVNGEQPAMFTIPLRLIDDQLLFTLNPNYGYQSDSFFNVDMEVANTSAEPFLLRFYSSNIHVSDDIGNIYTLGGDNGYTFHSDQYADLIDGNNSFNETWRFSPAISPHAKSLTLSTEVMGRPYSQIINLEHPIDQIRYESKVSHVIGNTSTIKVTVFNLSKNDFLLRLAYNNAQIQTPDGNILATINDPSKLVMGNMPPGESLSFMMSFDVKLTETTGLKLVIPIVSAYENVKIDIQPNEQ